MLALDALRHVPNIGRMEQALLELVFAPSQGDEYTPSRGVRKAAHSDDDTVHSEREPLLVRLADGDVTAFDQLVLAYDPPLRAFARRMLHEADLANDIVQDVFVWLWEHRTTVRPQGTLRSYLYGAVRHRALHVLRRARMEEACAFQLDPAFGIPGMGVPEPGTAAATERRELAAALTRALLTLSPRVRQVALLRWRDRMSRAEIAGIMGVAVPTINNQLTQAARLVRSLLADYVPPTP